MIEYLLNMRSIICQNTKFRIELTPVKPEISPKPSVNLFFKTLAEEMGDRAIGVVLLVHANEQFTAGTLKLEPHAFKQVQAKLLNSKEMQWQTDNLLGALPAIELSEVAGVAALNALPQSQQGFQLYLLRGCETYQISWGGRPDKPHEQQGELAISPRRSFEKWIETRLSFSMPWSEDTRLKLMKLRLLLQLLK